MGRWAGARLRTGVVVAAVVSALAVSGCGGEESAEAAAEEQQVVTGTVLDGPGGEPVDGVEVELLVWPAPQAGSTGTAGEQPDLVEADEAVTGADGTFTLSALPGDLTPHAHTGGSVGIEVRVAGTDRPGTRTSVALRRAADTGITSVVAVHDLVLTLPDGADAS